jgi:hypothetical protein
LKKPTGSVWFRFYKLETEKTELNPNRKKPSRTQTEKNRAELEKNRAKIDPNRKNRVKLKKPSQTSLNRFFF